MIEIAFLIFKIIGIVLLCILSVLVLVILVILFCPIRYSISAKASNTKESISVQGQCKWLLGAFRVKFHYNYPEFQWSGYILFINLHKLLQSKKDTEASEDDLSSHTEAVGQDSKLEPCLEAETDVPSREIALTKEKKDTGKHTNKRNKIIEKIKNIYKRIKFTIIRICDNIKLIRKRKDMLVDFLYDDIHQLALQSCKAQLFSLLRKYKPSKLHLHAHIGFEDPSLTGKMVAWLSVIYPIYGNTIDVIPDFEETAMEGDGILVGKIYGYPLVVCGLRLILNKNIRRTVNDIKNIEW